MSKLNLQPIPSGYASVQAINDRFALIEAAIEDTVSRSNKLPNSMEADFNLDGNSILNIDSFQAQEITLGGESVGLGPIQEIVGIGQDIKTLAEIEDGTIYTGAISTLAPISNDIVEAAGVSENINILGPIAQDIVNVSSVYTHVPVVSNSIDEVVDVSSNISAVQIVSADLGGGGFPFDLGSITDGTEAPDPSSSLIATVATNITEVFAVGDNIDAVLAAPGHAQDAKDARDKAQLWAEEAEDIEVEPGQFSAFHWAQKAQEFAAGAAENISYDNTASGITAENVQAAIDKLVSIKASIDGGNTFTGTQNINGDVNITGTLDCGSLV